MVEGLRGFRCPDLLHRREVGVRKVLRAEHVTVAPLVAMIFLNRGAPGPAQPVADDAKSGTLPNLIPKLSRVFDCK
jgi:hypothetical protein